MIRLHEPTFGEEEIEAVASTIRSTYVTQGDKVAALENAFCEMFGFKYAIACNSGSSANLLALAAAIEVGWLPRGGRVCVSALCWSTTIAPIVQLGLVPVVIDCDLHTLNQDLIELERVNADYWMPVHVYGNPCEIPPHATARRVVEDCCESLGAKSPDSSSIGLTANAATFSFYYSHHITTMEGGMVASSDREFSDIVRSLRSHGWTRDVKEDWDWALAPAHIDPRFWFPLAGYNLRMTEPQAAMGLIQLPKLAGFVERRRWAHGALRERLENVPGLILQSETVGARASWFGFTIISEHRDAIVAALKGAGVETRPIIAGNITEHNMLLRYPHQIIGTLPNADRVMLEGFSLPCHQALTESDVDLMAETIRGAVCAL